MAYKPWKSSDSVILNPQELQEFSGRYLGNLFAFKVFMIYQPTDFIISLLIK